MAAEGLLEVVADELGVVGRIPVGSALQPTGMSFMKVGAQVLGDTAVGRVANQDVVEAVRLLIFEVGRFRGGSGRG